MLINNSIQIDKTEPFFAEPIIKYGYYLSDGLTLLEIMELQGDPDEAYLFV